MVVFDGPAVNVGDVKVIVPMVLPEATMNAKKGQSFLVGDCETAPENQENRDEGKLVKMFTAAAKTDLGQVYRELVGQKAVREADLDSDSRPNMEQFLEQVRADLKLQRPGSVHGELKERVAAHKQILVQSDLKLQTVAIKTDIDSVYDKLKGHLAAHKTDLDNANSIANVQLSGKAPIEYLELILEEMMMQTVGAKTDRDQVIYHLNVQKAEPTADLDNSNCWAKEFKVKHGTELAEPESSVLDTVHPLVISCFQGRGGE
ncbi:unnamed protein product, partial [Prorocentrum cordatum]